MKKNTLCKACQSRGWLNWDSNKIIIESMKLKCENCGKEIE